MNALEPHAQGTFIPRCWIHTHPRWKAYMSSTDIFQLYVCACQYSQSFGIVISPRGAGLKALCVHLTEVGFTEVRRFCQEATARKIDVMNNAISQISASEKKFYCQIPFDVSSDPCISIDLREEKEVTSQLCNCITNDGADVCWISPLSS